VAVERFDVGVLPGCARLDVAGTGAGVAAPVAECFGDELGSVVAAQVLGRTASLLDEALEDADGLVGVDRAGRDAGERFAGVLVGDVEDLDWPTISGLVEEEVERPDLVGCLLRRRVRRGTCNPSSRHSRCTRLRLQLQPSRCSSTCTRR
jgi:hypothetical protein